VSSQPSHIVDTTTPRSCTRSQSDLWKQTSKPTTCHVPVTSRMSTRSSWTTCSTQQSVGFHRFTAEVQLSALTDGRTTDVEILLTRPSLSTPQEQANDLREDGMCSPRHFQLSFDRAFAVTLFEDLVLTKRQIYTSTTPSLRRCAEMYPLKYLVCMLIPR